MLRIPVYKNENTFIIKQAQRKLLMKEIRLDQIQPYLLNCFNEIFEIHKNNPQEALKHTLNYIHRLYQETHPAYLFRSTVHLVKYPEETDEDYRISLKIIRDDLLKEINDRLGKSLSVYPELIKVADFFYKRPYLLEYHSFKAALETIVKEVEAYKKIPGNENLLLPEGKLDEILEKAKIAALKPVRDHDSLSAKITAHARVTDPETDKPKKINYRHEVLKNWDKFIAEYQQNEAVRQELVEDVANYIKANYGRFSQLILDTDKKNLDKFAQMVDTHLNGLYKLLKSDSTFDLIDSFYAGIRDEYLNRRELLVDLLAHGILLQNLRDNNILVLDKRNAKSDIAEIYNYLGDLAADSIYTLKPKISYLLYYNFVLQKDLNNNKGFPILNGKYKSISQLRDKIVENTTYFADDRANTFWQEILSKLPDEYILNALHAFYRPSNITAILSLPEEELPLALSKIITGSLTLNIKPEDFVDRLVEGYSHTSDWRVGFDVPDLFEIHIPGKANVPNPNSSINRHKINPVVGFYSIRSFKETGGSFLTGPAQLQLMAPYRSGIDRVWAEFLGNVRGLFSEPLHQIDKEREKRLIEIATKFHPNSETIKKTYFQTLPSKPPMQRVKPPTMLFQPEFPQPTSIIPNRHNRLSLLDEPIPPLPKELSYDNDTFDQSFPIKTSSLKYKINNKKPITPQIFKKTANKGSASTNSNRNKKKQSGLIPVNSLEQPIDFRDTILYEVYLGKKHLHFDTKAFEESYKFFMREARSPKEIKDLRDSYLALQLAANAASIQYPDLFPPFDADEETLAKVSVDISALKVMEEKFGLDTKSAFKLLYSPPDKKIIKQFEKGMEKNYFINVKPLLDSPIFKNYFTDPDVVWRKIDQDYDNSKLPDITYVMGYLNAIYNKWKDPSEKKIKIDESDNKQNKGFLSKILSELKSWGLPPLLGALIGGGIGGLGGATVGSLAVGPKNLLTHGEYVAFPALTGSVGGAGIGLVTSGIKDIEEGRNIRGLLKTLLPIMMAAAFRNVIGYR